MSWETILWSVVALAVFGVYHWLEERRHRGLATERGRIIDAYEKHIEHQYSEIKDLRDRLFQSKAMPPSGVDLTEAYEERKKNDREHKERTQGKHNPAGPLERLTEKWKDKDLKAASEGLDYTNSRNRAN